MFFLKVNGYIEKNAQNAIKPNTAKANINKIIIDAMKLSTVLTNQLNIAHIILCLFEKVNC